MHAPAGDHRLGVGCGMRYRDVGCDIGPPHARGPSPVTRCKSTFASVEAYAGKRASRTVPLYWRCFRLRTYVLYVPDEGYSVCVRPKLSCVSDHGLSDGLVTCVICGVIEAAYDYRSRGDRANVVRHGWFVARSGTKNSKYLVSSMAKAKAAARRPRLNRMLNRASGRPDCRSHRAQHRPFARWADAVSRLLNTDRFAFDHLHLRLFGCIPSARVVCVVSFGYFPNTTYRTSIVPRAAAGDHVRCGAAATREQSCGTSLSLSMMFASSLYRLSVSSYGSHTVSSGTSLTTRSTAKPMPRPELLP